MTRRAIGVACLAVCAATLLVALAAPASAHAELERSRPAGGATLSRPPRAVVLWFSEPLESFSQLQVFDAGGTRVDRGVPTIDGRVLRVAVRSRRPGRRTVVFRVLSEDGHVVQSRFTFVVGRRRSPPPPSLSPSPSASPQPTSTPTASPSAVARPTQVPTPPATADTGPGLGDIALIDAGTGTAAGLWAARLGGYVALTAATGLLFAATALFAGQAALVRRCTRAGAVAALLLAVCAVLLFVFGLSTASARPLPSALDGELVRRFAATRLGRLALAQASVAILAAAAAAIARTRHTAAGALALVAVAALAPGLSGHAGANRYPLLAVAMDWVHVLAVTLWVGGLAVLVWADRLATRVELAAPARRFSRLAVWALATVALSGVVGVALNVASPDQLWTTTWGRLVLAKAVALMAIALIGAAIRIRVLPHITTPSGASPVRAVFRRFAAVEAVVMLLALMTATQLAASPPPTTAQVTSAVLDFSGGQINVTIEPAAGVASVHVYVLDATGRPRAADRPHMTLAGGGRTRPVRLARAGPGHFVALGQRLPDAESYDVAMSAVVDGTEIRTHGVVDVQP